MGEQQVGGDDPLPNCASKKGITGTQHVLLPQLHSLQVRHTHVSAQALCINTHSTSMGGTYAPSDKDCKDSQYVHCDDVNNH